MKTKLEQFRVKEIVLETLCGSPIHEALREAAMLALEENRVAVFKHNGTTYRIMPTEITAFLRKKGVKETIE